MKYWFGYLTAGIFGAITWVLMQFGERFSVLVDMIYPYVIRTLESTLAEWSAGAVYPLWQTLAVVLGVLVLASLVLVIVLKWNPIQWAGWVLAVFAGIYMLHTTLWGLNYYAGSLADDMRLEVGSYNLEELTEATEYYRDMANIMALMVNRDSSGKLDFADFETLAEEAGEGFQCLTYDYSYPIFAGSTLPVKKLGWSDMYTSMGITGVTFGLTGEACVNPQIPDVSLPFTMAHEMAHRMCIAPERDANFAAFLACSVHSDPEFQYSAYFMAYRYCYSALSSADPEAAARVWQGVSAEVAADCRASAEQAAALRSETASRVSNQVYDTYLKSFSVDSGVQSYGEVTDLLLGWYFQRLR